MIHRFEPTAFHATMGSHDPVLTVADGDTIETWCVDAAGEGPDGTKLHEGGNPQTGPFFVEGATRGDTLAVRFDRLWPNRTNGWSGGLVAPNVLDPDLAARMPYDKRPDDSWTLDLERGTARLDDPP